MKKLLVLLILVGSLVGLGEWLHGLASQPSIATVGTSTTTAVAPSMPVGVQPAPSTTVTAVSARSAPRAATAPATTTVRPATVTTVRPSSTPTTAAPRVTTSTTLAPTTSTTVTGGPPSCSLKLIPANPSPGHPVNAEMLSNQGGNVPTEAWVHGSTDRDITGSTNADGSWRFYWFPQPGDSGDVVVEVPSKSAAPGRCSAHYAVA